MDGLYEFLCWMQGNRTDKRNIYAYKRNNGEKYFEFCCKHSLIVECGRNSLYETLYALTQKGMELINSKDFNDALERLKEEEKL